MPDALDERPSDGGFWNDLREEQRDRLRRAGHRRTFWPRAEPLCFEGDLSTDVVIIMSGWAKVMSDTGAGQEIVFAVRGPGEIVGEISALFGRPRSATVRPLVRVEAIAVAAGRFRAFLEEDPLAWRSLTGTLVSRIDELGHRLRMQAEADSARRLAHLLHHLATLSGRYQRTGPDGAIEILPPLSQLELGRWMDASRETAARGFRELRDRGLVSTARKKITVLDPERLRAFADGGPAR